MEFTQPGQHGDRFGQFSFTLRLKAAALAVCLTAAAVACAQNTEQAPGDPAKSSSAAQAGTQNPPSTQPKIGPVTTTVEVHGEVNSDYRPESVTVGTIDGAPLKNAPLSATVVTRDVLNDQVARLLSDVVKNDASVEDDYVPVGYYGGYQIRGFPIDLATGLEINGLTIAGEQDVPLENKERVEFLNGLAGVESGVAAGGGLIDYVTKRPAAIKAVDLASDEYGTAYGAADVGRFFGAGQQVGARVNLAGERIETYMNGTGGWRAMGAGAADWKITPKTILKGDFEYQHKTERDGSGYQLLGGTTVPDIHRIFPSTMLGEQAWGPPDTYDVFNTGARLDWNLSPNWLAFAAGSLSHSLIQDNVIYAYGTPFDANGNVDCQGAPDAPAYFFCPAVPGVTEGGDYGIYDYRDPGELRMDAVAVAMATGRVQTGAIEQDITVGGELFRRSVQMPGFYAADNPSSPDGIVQDGAVYAYVGPDNIYQPLTAYAPAANSDGVLLQAGPRRLWEDSHQSSIVAQDRVRLPGRVQLIAGGRYDALRDHNYSLVATAPCVTSATPGPPNDPCPTTYDTFGNPIYSVPNSPALTDKPAWLPQFAITYNPASSLTLYANYGVMLSLGPQGPWWTNDDPNQFLAPYNTRQVEAGAKYESAQSILLSADFFHMRAPFFYSKVLAAADPLFPTCAFDLTASTNQCFVSQGRETHNGVELNAQGKAARWLQITASAAAIDATSDNTGTSTYDGKQVINVPHLRTAVFADMAVPRVAGLSVMPGWSYSGRKEALRDDTVSVPGYNLFDLGLRYTPGGEHGRATFRIYAENLADKRYWSDTGASLGDTFIWLGAPTSVRVEAHYQF